jgi:hypothetical protein
MKAKMTTALMSVLVVSAAWAAQDVPQAGVELWPTWPYHEGTALQIGKVFPRSPASEAKIPEGSLLIAINGTNMVGIRPATAQELLCGEEGARVTLTLAHGGRTNDTTLALHKIVFPDFPEPDCVGTLRRRLPRLRTGMTIEQVNSVLGLTNALGGIPVVTSRGAFYDRRVSTNQILRLDFERRSLQEAELIRDDGKRERWPK